MDIRFAITEIGHLNCNHNIYRATVTCSSSSYKFNPMSCEEFAPCTKAIIHKTNFLWFFTHERDLLEADIIELSSSHLIVQIYKVYKIPEEPTNDHYDLIGNCNVSLGDVILNSPSNICEIKLCKPTESNNYLSHRTGNLFIRYQIKSTGVMWKTPINRDNSLQKLSIYINGIYNPNNVLINFRSIDIGILLPTEEALAKRNMFYFHIPGNSEVGNLINIQKRNDPSIIFDRQFQCSMFKRSIKKIVTNQKLAIEIKVTPLEVVGDAESVYLLGIMDLEKLNIVAVEKLCLNVPLVAFDAGYLKQQTGNGQPIFVSDVSKFSQKTKASKINDEIKAPKLVTNDKGLSTFVLLEISVQPPLMNAKKFDSCFKRKPELITRDQDITSTQRRNFNAFGKSYLNEHQRALLDYNQNGNNRCTGFYQNGCIYVHNEKMLLQSSVYMCKTIFRYPHKIINDVEAIYVKLINELKMYLIGTPLTLFNQMTLKRLVWATELYELGLVAEAEDMYIVNIVNNSHLSSLYVDYGIFNLQRGHLGKAFKCLTTSLRKKHDSTNFLAKFLITSILYSMSQFDEAEKRLIQLTHECDNFIEAWTALFLIQSQKIDKSSSEYRKQKLEKASASPFRVLQHNSSDYLWKSTSRRKNPQLEALINILQWGCLEYAELGFSTLHNKYNYDCFFNLAVIQYYRRNFDLVLQILRVVSAEAIWQEEQQIKLTLHCHLHIGNLDESLAIFRSIKSTLVTGHRSFINIIYLKLAKLYINLKKMRTSRFYLRKCLSLNQSYAGCKFLGYVALQCSNKETADNCISLAYEMVSRKTTDEILKVKA